MKQLPAYTNETLQIAMDSDIPFPEAMTEVDFQFQIKVNTKVKWRVNSMVLSPETARVLLNPNEYHRLVAMHRLGNLVFVYIVYWSLRTWKPEMLLLLPLLPLTLVGFSHITFSVIMASVISSKICFEIAIPLFWIIVPAVALSYCLIKWADEWVERLIRKRAFADWQSFWRFYYNQVIYIDPIRKLSEQRNLFERYPELVLIDDNMH
ncbi:MAG: hypothetical protein ABWZ25_18105 [Chitinophagaceae bacterium]